MIDFKSSPNPYVGSRQGGGDELLGIMQNIGNLLGLCVNKEGEIRFRALTTTGSRHVLSGVWRNLGLKSASK